MIDDVQIESNKLAAARGWIVAPSPEPTTAAEKVMDRYLKRTPEERAALVAAGNKRYAHLRDQERDWLADPTARKKRGQA